MKRRSFLSLLGLAPVAALPLPAIAEKVTPVDPDNVRYGFYNGASDVEVVRWMPDDGEVWGYMASHGGHAGTGRELYTVNYRTGQRHTIDSEMVWRKLDDSAR